MITDNFFVNLKKQICRVGSEPSEFFFQETFSVFDTTPLFYQLLLTFHSFFVSFICKTPKKCENAFQICIKMGHSFE